MTTNLLNYAAVDHEIQRRLQAADDARLARLARGPRRWPTRPRGTR